MAKTAGLELLIGGNLVALQRALKDSEAAVKASAQRQLAVTQEVAAAEARVFQTATQQRINGIKTEAAETKKRIQAEIQDKQQQQALILRLERATAEEVNRIQIADLQKRTQAAGAAAKEQRDARAAAARDLARRETSAFDSATAQKTLRMQQEADAQKRHIQETIKDQTEAARLVARLERATAADIRKVRTDAHKADQATAAKAMADQQGVQVDALRAKYQHLNQVGDAFGVGVGGKVATLRAQLAELNTSGLAGTVAGMHAVADVEHELEVATASLGMGFVAMGAAAATALSVGVAAAVGEFARFEVSLNRVQALSQGTTADMERVGAAAISLGAATKFSAVEAAEGIAELVSAGFSLDQAMTAIPGVLDTAAADMMGVGKAAEIVGAVLNGFGLEATQATRVSDLLAKVAAVSAVGIGDMGESLKYASTIAASTSQSIEEVSTQLAIMANAGIKGSQAGTTYRSAMAALVKPVGDAGAVLEKLGITVAGTDGKMRPLSNILGQLRDKTASMGESQRNAAIATIFGQESLSGMLAVMRKTEPEMAAIAAQLRDYTGASKSMADTMSKGVTPAIEQAKGAMSSLGIAMGESFAPAIVSVANALGSLAMTLKDADPAMKTTVATATTFAIAAPAITAFTMALRAVAPAALSARLGVAGLVAILGGPAVAAILAGSAALAGYVYWTDATARAAHAARVEQEKATQAAVGEVAANHSRTKAIQALVAEHDALISKVKLTKAEKARLHALQVQMAAMSPAIAAAVEKAGNAHWKTLPAINAETQALAKNTAEKIRNARVSGVALQQQLNTEQAGLARLVAAADGAEGDAAAGARGGSYGEAGQGAQSAGLGASIAASLARRKVDAQAEVVAALGVQVGAQARIMSDLARANRDPKITIAKVGAANPYNDGKDPKVKKGKSGAAAANQGFANAKAAADAQAAYEQAIADLSLATAQDVSARKLAVLDAEKAAGKKTEQQYLRDVQQLRLDDADMAAAVAQWKLEIDRKRVADELAAIKVGDKAKADERKGLEGRLATIGLQGQKIERVRLAQHAAITADGDAKAAKQREADQDRADALDADLTTRRLDREAQLADARVRLLPAYEQERAAIKATHEAAIAKADDVHTREVAAINLQERHNQITRDEAILKRAAADEDRNNAKTLAEIAQTLAVKAAAERAAGAVRGLALSLAGLVVTPGIDGVAGILSGIAGNVDGLREAEATIRKMQEASAGVGGGLEGAGAALGVLTQGLNPLQVGLTGAVLVAEKFADMAKAAAENFEKAASDALRLADLQAKLTPDDLLKQKAAEENRREAATGAELTKRMESYKAMRPLWFLDIDGMMAEFNAINADWFKSLDADAKVFEADWAERFAARKAEIQQLDQGSAAGLAESQARAAGQFGKEGQKYGLVVNQGDLGEKSQAYVDERLTAYNAGLDRLNAIDEENTSERDARGNRITLEQRKQLDLADAQAEHQAKLNDLLKDETKLREDLAQLAEDEAADIRAILDEGAATRSKTEYEDKTTRIKDVQDKAKTRREEIAASLEDIKTKRKAEEDAYSDATARIRTLADERISALGAERLAIMANVEALGILIGKQQSLNAAQGVRAAEVKAQGAAGYVKGVTPTSGGSSSGSSAKSSSASVGEVRANQGGGGNVKWDGTRWNDVPKFHTGGVVPGRPGQEVPIIAQAGEEVRTSYQAAQDRNNADTLAMVQRWIASVQRPATAALPPGYGSGGGTTVNLGGITINAAAGQDTRAIAREVMAEVDARLRRSSLGR